MTISRVLAVVGAICALLSLGFSPTVMMALAIAFLCFAVALDGLA